MLKKPNNYDSIEVKEYDYTPIELGGHKLVIKIAEEYTSDYSGNTSLKVTVDTASSDKQPNYFQAQFDNDTRADKKWSNGATKYVSLKENEVCERMLKAFITAVENSNSGFTFDWKKEVTQLNGKFIGGIFGLEEYENNEGNLKTATKLTQFRSVDKVDNAKIPKVKTLNNGYVEYETYITNKNKESESLTEAFNDIVEVDENFLD